ncbi:hypothetical protein Desca_1457 [Desulfotomaculum nigrificans CO-1-SRB]|uniref:Uncharacterized protein n=1 Tax=Desulfotomaculum nigrificans (strain DSM 14880 / VKM B-2319 / CO-1-SRB) TaxID=868595 RepID=F6B5Z3_DESCC|nr:hypothetical protein [Desulfotomaculum nigrificans]AEF94312.1 hypothetical protein Desca_1457 [Desulfotomaculum nigrificans CO-1-SRB]
MQWHGLRLPVVFLAFVCGLILAFGGQYVYKEYIFQQPLNEILAENKLVDEFKVDNDTQIPVIKVKLANNHVSLMEAYQQLNQSVGQVMNKKPYELEFISNSDASLDQAFYESHYVIYQAQVAGNFPDVAAKVKQAAAKQGAEGKVFVDENNIYIQMYKPDGHYLNKVIPRQNTLNGVTLQGGGQIAKGN